MIIEIAQNTLQVHLQAQARRRRAGIVDREPGNEF